LCRSLALELAQNKHPIADGSRHWEPLTVARVTARKEILVEVPPIHLS
jgi:hypothetical protein